MTLGELVSAISKGDTYDMFIWLYGTTTEGQRYIKFAQDNETPSSSGSVSVRFNAHELKEIFDNHPEYGEIKVESISIQGFDLAVDI